MTPASTRAFAGTSRGRPISGRPTRSSEDPTQPRLGVQGRPRPRGRRNPRVHDERVHSDVEDSLLRRLLAAPAKGSTAPTTAAPRGPVNATEDKMMLANDRAVRPASLSFGSRARKQDAQDEDRSTVSRQGAVFDATNHQREGRSATETYVHQDRRELSPEARLADHVVRLVLRGCWRTLKGRRSRALGPRTEFTRRDGARRQEPTSHPVAMACGPIRVVSPFETAVGRRDVVVGVCRSGWSGLKGWSARLVSV